MRGGKRTGAGRKKLAQHRNRVVLYVTEEEELEIRNLLNQLRDDTTAQKSIEPVGQECIEISAQESEIPVIIEDPESIEVDTVETSEQELEEPVIIADDEDIMTLYNNNARMPKGKFEFIASVLNSKRWMDADGSEWSSASVRKKIQKLKRFKSR